MWSGRAFHKCTATQLSWHSSYVFVRISGGTKRDEASGSSDLASLYSSTGPWYKMELARGAIDKHSSILNCGRKYMVRQWRSARKGVIYMPTFVQVLQCFRHVIFSRVYVLPLNIGGSSHSPIWQWLQR